MAPQTEVWTVQNSPAAGKTMEVVADRPNYKRIMGSIFFKLPGTNGSEARSSSPMRPSSSGRPQSSGSWLGRPTSSGSWLGGLRPMSGGSILSTGSATRRRKAARDKARNEVISILKTYVPGVYKKLGLPDAELSTVFAPTDIELFKAYALVDCPGSFARSVLGCSEFDIVMLDKLMPAAVVEFPEASEDESKLDPCTRMVCCVFAVLVLAVIGLGIPAIMMALERAKWTKGTCRIATFTKGNCTMMPCLLTIGVAEGEKYTGQTEILKESWELPVANVEFEDRQRLGVTAKPFHCCYDSCCSWYSEKWISFCDNFPNHFSHKEDNSACHSGRWRCLFQKGQENGNDIATSVQVNPDDILEELMVAIYVVSGLALLLAVLRTISKATGLDSALLACWDGLYALEGSAHDFGYEGSGSTKPHVEEGGFPKSRAREEAMRQKPSGGLLDCLRGLCQSTSRSLSSLRKKHSHPPEVLKLDVSPFKSAVSSGTAKTDRVVAFSTDRPDIESSSAPPVVDTNKRVTKAILYGEGGRSPPQTLVLEEQTKKTKSKDQQLRELQGRMSVRHEHTEMLREHVQTLESFARAYNSTEENTNLIRPIIEPKLQSSPHRDKAKRRDRIAPHNWAAGAPRPTDHNAVWASHVQSPHATHSGGQHRHSTHHGREHGARRSHEHGHGGSARLVRVQDL